mgnify:CR=1 FL=1
MMSSIWSILSRDIHINIKTSKDIFLVIGIYISIILVFPFSLGPKSETLLSISPAIIWISALVTSINVFDKIFENDIKDGWFDQLLISKIPLEIIVIMKALAHWISVGVPLIIISPIICLLFNMSLNAIYITLISLTLGTLSLTLIGIMGAALILGSRRTSALITFLVLPLTFPILIFGVSAINAELYQKSSTPHLFLLAMCLCFLLILSPIATSAAIRIASE